MKKSIEAIQHGHAPHMVGDGLPVSNFFSYGDLGRQRLSPFLMLDYGRPAQFPVTTKRLGVGMHPHRGFETVTIVLQGGLEHRDTAGNSGTIAAGDVQWMTAGSGVMHEEMHSTEFRKRGGVLQMLQLWVNLPAKDKMTPPAYQTLVHSDIPSVTTENGSVSVRVIAGKFGETKGPARTFTPVNLWDISFTRGGLITPEFEDEFTTVMLVVSGSLTVTAASQRSEDTITEVKAEQLIIFSRTGEEVTLRSDDARLIVLNGQPIEEPVVGYGPFVMNTQQQIQEAFHDFQTGRFGR